MKKATAIKLPAPLLDDGELTPQTVDLAMRHLFEVMIGDMEPSNEITHGIVLGLFVKAKKLYQSCYSAIKSDDVLAFSILIRSYYEVTITLRYILTYLVDEDTIKQFIIGDAMERLYSLKGDLKGEKLSKEEYEFQIEMLRKSLEHRGINIKEVPNGYPRSWHPKLTYRAMAGMLDDTGEALGIYDALYGSTSLLAHPSLEDILKWHVTQKFEGEPYVANEHNMFMKGEGEILLACTGLAAMEAISLSATELAEKSYAESIANLHLRMHQTFNDTRDPLVRYLESLKDYAEFMDSNYPSIT